MDEIVFRKSSTIFTKTKWKLIQDLKIGISGAIRYCELSFSGIGGTELTPFLGVESH